VTQRGIALPMPLLRPLPPLLQLPPRQRRRYHRRRGRHPVLYRTGDPCERVASGRERMVRSFEPSQQGPPRDPARAEDCAAS
jgi:hypothetical protein